MDNENEGKIKIGVDNINEEQDENENIGEEVENNEAEKEENLVIKRKLTEEKEYDKSIKIILLGDSSVGKTSIVRRLCQDDFRYDVQATISIEYYNYILSINEYMIRMQIWDTAGQEKFNSIVSNYYKSTNVGIFVYSINNEESFERIKQWYQEAKENITNKDNDTEVFNILIGNKCDLEEERKVSKEQGEQFKEENGFLLFEEISCRNDELEMKKKIIEIFDSIGKVYYNIYKQRRTFTGDSDSLNYEASKSIIELAKKEKKKEEDKQAKQNGSKCC